MKNCTSLLFLCFFQSAIAQDLLLVIDEQFANKTFDSFDDVNWVQYNGQLDWIKKSSLFGDNSQIVDLGSGAKLEHYMMNLDSLYIYSRAENAYTNSDGLVVEANNHGVINDQKSLSGISLYYPWTFRRGYFEIEAKLAAGQGIVSTWFFFGSRPGMEEMCDGSQISNWQEVDVFETGGAYPNDLRNNIHWSNYLSGTADCSSCEDSHCTKSYGGINDDNDPNFMTAFHKFGLYWDEDFVIFLIDGYIYRYWLKTTPVDKQHGLLDPVRFEDAMVNHFTCQYGVQELIETSKYEEPGLLEQLHLNPPNPSGAISEGAMQINYFRYWIILPCEQGPDTSFSLISGYPVLANKEINNYNESSFGYYESGKNIYCSNSEILPSVDGSGQEIPYDYPQKLNLIASKSITLENGFHAKASSNNYQVTSNFHGKIQTCASVSNFQPMPFIQNFDLDTYETFKENFFGNMADMISASYSNSSPLKSTIQIQSDSLNFIAEMTGIIITPNPVSDEVTLKMAINKECHVEIYDSFGNIVAIETNFISGQAINIGNLPSGVYYIKIHEGAYLLTSKFVKI